ncbi:MAG: ATP-binding protein [Campylobacter sp.]|nr:ATP-binding protein [Campylobacter sp.]
MIKREHYIKQVRGFYDSDLIKVITGIRRCGKSVILEQIKTELEVSGKKCLYLNLEDHTVSAKINNEKDLIEYVLSAKNNGIKYVFLDEVQNIENWNLACKTLRLHGLSLFITGSNSKLLSSEFTKELSGRYISFHVRPFVYKELLEYAKELNTEISFSDYLIFGGFPKIVEFENKDDKTRYLNELNETIIFNDIISRYNIRKIDLFRRITNFVLMSNSRIFSANSIYTYIKQQKINCSVNTIMKYLAYLKEAYIIRTLSQYSTKAKRKLEFFEKIYNEDVGFNTIKQNLGEYDITHNLENIVYNELIYMGYELFVYNVGGKEIDFLAVKNSKKYLIQVAYSVVEEKAKKREFEPFNALDNEFAKILITNDEIDFSTSTVRHIKFKDFLTLESLE